MEYQLNTCHASGVATEHVGVSVGAVSMPVACLQLGRPIYGGWTHVVVVTYPREYRENEVVPQTAKLAARKLGVDEEAIGVWFGCDAKCDFDRHIGGL